MVTDGTYIYIMCAPIARNLTIIKVRISDWTTVATWVDDGTYTMNNNSLNIAGGNLYLNYGQEHVGPYAGYIGILKINTTSMNVSGHWRSTDDQYGIFTVAYALCISGNYAYDGYAKVNITTMTWDSDFSVGITAIGMITDNTYIYAVERSNPARVSKTDIATDTSIILTLAASEKYGIAISSDGTYLYVSCTGFLSPLTTSKVVKIFALDMSISGVLDFGVYSTSLSRSCPDSLNLNVLLGVLMDLVDTGAMTRIGVAINPTSYPFYDLLFLNGVIYLLSYVDYYLAAAILTVSWAEIQTDPATDITDNSAILHGELTVLQYSSANCGFEYGTDTSYGSTTPLTTLAAIGNFANTISGLAPSTTYHYRSIAWIGGQKVVGADATFTTLATHIVTTTVVTSSLNPSTYGNNVTFTATVSSALATGTAQFYIDGVAYGSPIALTAGVAAITLNNIAVGSHIIAADYSGDTVYLPSSGTVTQIVNKIGTTMVLASSLNPAPFGHEITFTATVSPAAATGQVQFTIDGYGYWLPVNLVSGIASVIISDVEFLTVGTHLIRADYLGDSNYLPSSDMLSEVVLAVKNLSNPVSRRKL
jgi:hypothetical protein